jgi:hypothetical protein
VPANGKEEAKPPEPPVLKHLHNCRERVTQIEQALAALEALGDDLAQRASDRDVQRLQEAAMDLWERAGDLRGLARSLTAVKV